MASKWKSRTYVFVLVGFLIVSVYVPLGWLSEGTWKFVFAVGAGAWVSNKIANKFGNGNGQK